ncbi:MAG: D-alanine--D-alanine ligase [Thalassotalea sp.]
MINLAEKVAVLYGGTSQEREVSLNSGQAVAKGLAAAGFTDIELIDTKGFELSELNKLAVKRVFIALHGKGGEDGTLQGALEFLHLPYTGSGVLGSALAMDKVRCKQIWRSLGYPTADFAVVHKDEFEPALSADILAALGGKAMVKPASEGSSIGMSIAKSADELSKALITAFDYDEQVLVEAWIDGKEYTVAILGNEALPAIHMETPNEFYDYQAKYQSTSTQYHCPCGLDTAAEEKLQTLAVKAFKAVNASGWGRVDFMLNEQGDWQLLEVNTVPGMTETSLVPKAAKVAGYSFSDLVKKIISLSDIRK